MSATRSDLPSPKQSGMTLIEVMIAITLLGLLMAGLMWAMRVSLTSLGKANDKLIANRRVTGAQRVLEQQIAGFMPVTAAMSGPEGLPGTKLAFFQGEEQSMRFVSTYSLREGSRGVPRILEFQVIPGEQAGVRLIVNELPYTGSLSAGLLVVGREPNPDGIGLLTHFRPIEPGPQSFVLADKLASCHFIYEELLPQPRFQRWTPLWTKDKWPDAIRIEMTPVDNDPGRLKMMTLTAPVHVSKLPLETYNDR
jgi:prepilin-type N-terminal cleavage/methylation domain-containing protein